MILASLNVNTYSDRKLVCEGLINSGYAVQVQEVETSYGNEYWIHVFSPEISEVQE